MKRFERGKNPGLGSVRGKWCDSVTQILASLFSIFSVDLCRPRAPSFAPSHFDNSIAVDCYSELTPFVAVGHDQLALFVVASPPRNSLFYLSSPRVVFFPARSLSWCSSIPSRHSTRTPSTSHPIVSISAVLALPLHLPTSPRAVSGC